jgi:hypothetical protein
LIDGWDFLYREVNKRIRTNNPSWKSHPSVGVTLRDFIGRPNTEANALELRKRIRDKLTDGNIGFPGDFDVTIVPNSRDSVMINIDFYLSNLKTNVTKMIYDFSNGVVQDVDEVTVVRVDTPVETKPYNIPSYTSSSSRNKYQDVIDRGL